MQKSMSGYRPSLLMLLLITVAAHGCKAASSTAGDSIEAAAPLLQVSVASPEPSPQHWIGVKDQRGDTYYISELTLLTEHDVARAVRYTTSNGDPGVHVMLTSDGERRLEAAAADYVGKHLAIFVHGELMSVPLVHDPVRQLAIFRCSTPMTDSEVENLIQAFNSR